MKPVRLTMKDDGSPVYIYPHRVCLVRNARSEGGGTLIVTVADSVTVRESLAIVVNALSA